jgi:triacylglycerol lipase
MLRAAAVRVAALLALAAVSALVAPRPASAFCLFNCTYTKTKYPIVLAHGLGGFDELFGVLDYWFGIEDALEDGGARVYVTSVAPLNTPQARGEQLIDQIETIVAITGQPKVNLIGHSQGGLDVRYVAAVRPDLVASVTTVGSPHKGADLADFLVANFVNGGFTQAVVGGLGNALGTVLGLLGGNSNPNDAIGALRALTAASMASFNAQYPAGVPATACGTGAATVGSIRLYSWSGTGILTNALDLGDPALGVASLFYNESNDGLVERCSSRFGAVIRDNYFMNHLDEVNQVLGLVSLFESNPKTVFRTHANRLKNAGL